MVTMAIFRRTSMNIFHARVLSAQEDRVVTLDALSQIMFCFNLFITFFLFFTLKGREDYNCSACRVYQLNPLFTWTYSREP